MSDPPSVLARGLVLLTAGVAGLALAVPRGQATAPTVALSRPVAAPTTSLFVSGTAFGAGEWVDVFFDRAPAAAMIAGATGEFQGAGVQVPTRAVPGAHWITAVGRQSGTFAQQSVLVEADLTESALGAAHPNSNQFENVVKRSNVFSLTWRWDAQLDLGSAAAAVAGGRLFIGSTSGLQALNAATGTPLWTAPVVAGVHSDPAVADDVVYAGADDGSLYAFDAATGARRWAAQTGAEVRSGPAVANRAVYVGSDDGRLYAFGLDGSPLWSAPTGGVVRSTPAITRGVVYVGSDDGWLYAFNATTGIRLWASRTGGPIRSSPAAADGRVFVGSSDGRLYAFDPTTGARLWTGPTGAPVRSSPAVANGVVYVGSDSGVLWAFAEAGCRAPDCPPLWTGATPAPIRSAPRIANAVVFTGSDDGSLYAFSAVGSKPCWAPTCAPVWSVPGSGGGPVSPAVANGIVYGAPSASGISAFSLRPFPGPPSRPDPLRLQRPLSPIRHIVVIDQENHSFDEVLGVLCARDQRCDSVLTGKLFGGTSIDLLAAADLVPDVDHSAVAQLVAIHGGKMDGFSRLRGCTAGLGYRCYQQYAPEQIPNLAALARAFALSDRTFETGVTSSWGSHLELVTTDSDGFAENPSPPTQSGIIGGWGWGCDSLFDAPWTDPLGAVRIVPACVPSPTGLGPYRPSPVAWRPTVMSLLDDAALSWRIYSLTPGQQGGAYGGAGSGYGWAICPTFTDCLYTAQHANVRPASSVITDARAGTLPNFAIAIPEYRNSQHNKASMLVGDNWIQSVVSAIMSGPDWPTTAIFITYDDCGCFYDHVPPPAGLGIRVPMVIVSPYARAGFTDSSTATFASILAYLEHTFGLPSLGNRDATAYDYSNSFDYTQPPLSPVPLEPHAIPEWERRWLESHPPEPEET